MARTGPDITGIYWVGDQHEILGDFSPRGRSNLADLYLRPPVLPPESSGPSGRIKIAVVARLQLQVYATLTHFEDMLESCGLNARTKQALKESAEAAIRAMSTFFWSLSKDRDKVQELLEKYSEQQGQQLRRYRRGSQGKHNVVQQRNAIIRKLRAQEFGTWGKIHGHMIREHDDLMAVKTRRGTKKPYISESHMKSEFLKEERGRANTV